MHAKNPAGTGSGRAVAGFRRRTRIGFPARERCFCRWFAGAQRRAQYSRARAFSNPIVFGPHMENFREIRDLFIEAHAAIEVQNAAELATTIERLLTDTQRAAELGARRGRSSRKTPAPPNASSPLCNEPGLQIPCRRPRQALRNRRSADVPSASSGDQRRQPHGWRDGKNAAGHSACRALS